MRLRLSRPLTDAAGMGAFVTVPFVAVLITLPGDRGLAAEVYILVLGALFLVALVRMTGEARQEGRRSLFEHAAKEQPASPDPLAELARMERDVVLATAERFDSPQRVRPLLRDIAELRLAATRGIDLRADREEAHAVLGDDVWELVDPERDPEAGPKLDLDRLEHAVSTLERL
jgi:hypothetical protein